MCYLAKGGGSDHKRRSPPRWGRGGERKAGGKGTSKRLTSSSSIGEGKNEIWKKEGKKEKPPWWRIKLWSKYSRLVTKHTGWEGYPAVHYRRVTPSSAWTFHLHLNVAEKNGGFPCANIVFAEPDAAVGPQANKSHNVNEKVGWGQSASYCNVY